LVYAALVLLFAGTSAAADPTPVPSLAASPVPKDFDPCGGPLELLNKIGSGTACVFVRGEAAVTAQYGSANIPATTHLNFMANTLDLSEYAHGFAYPASVMYVGITPRAQIAITLPSFVQINSGNLGTLAAGATDMQFDYKQIVYVKVPELDVVAVDLAYKAPTGSPVLRGPGPEYIIDPLVNVTLPHNFGLTIAVPVNNVTVSCSTCSSASRGWSLSPQLTPSWESPGGTLLSVSVQHDFNPSTTPVSFSAGQLIGRHFEFAVTYGGFQRTSSQAGPFLGLVSAANMAYPRLLSLSANYLFGRSSLPAALQQ